MKSYAVIGLGKFGYFVARGLAEQGANVIVADKDRSRIKDAAEYIKSAVSLDSTDVRALRQAGIVDLDVVVVSIGANIEASIMTVMALRDLGNKIVIAKAMSPIHGEILAKIGAFKVIYPEREAGRRLVRDLVGNVVLDRIDISNTVKVVKFSITKSHHGKRISDLETKEPHLVRAIACKQKGVWDMNPAQDARLEEGDLVVLMSNKEGIEAFCERA